MWRAMQGVNRRPELTTRRGRFSALLESRVLTSATHLRAVAEWRHSRSGPACRPQSAPAVRLPWVAFAMCLFAFLCLSFAALLGRLVLASALVAATALAQARRGPLPWLFRPPLLPKAALISLSCGPESSLAPSPCGAVHGSLLCTWLTASCAGLLIIRTCGDRPRRPSPPAKPQSKLSEPAAFGL